MASVQLRAYSWLAMVVLAYLQGVQVSQAENRPLTVKMPVDVPTVGPAENLWLLDTFEASASVPPNQLHDVSSTFKAVPQIVSPDASKLAGATTIEQLLRSRVGYDNGFIFASDHDLDIPVDEYPYSLRINGYGQLRNTIFDSHGSSPGLNQIQLKRARIIFSGHAFNPDFRYYVQLDGRSSSGDQLRILDYYVTYDIGHRRGNLEKGIIGVKTGLYKMPFSLARYLSGQEFEFADRSMASMYFDVNRSLAFGLYGRVNSLATPLDWEVALFNGLVTGGAETGSSGTLDDNYAVSGRIYGYPTGEWELGQLADLTGHDVVATRVGAGCAFSTVNGSGTTEFNVLRVVDTGGQLAGLLPNSVDEYDVALYSVDASMKFRGASLTTEYYFRNVGAFRGGSLPDLFDHGLWLQAGFFIVPGKLQLLSRWSRVQGSSGTLGMAVQSAEEIAAGFVRYFRQQNVKLTADATYLDGAPINSQVLDISPGATGWLYRMQFQFSF